MGRVFAALIFGIALAGHAGLSWGQAAGPVPLSFELIALPEGGRSVVAGTAEPGATVEILDRDRAIAMAVANRRGEWAVDLATELAPGAYRLAVRSRSADGGTVVIADRRIELVVPRPAAAASAAPRLPDRVVVTPGDNLWVIARRLYGSGVHYRELYDANRAIVANPRAVFPGQVLKVPALP